MTGKIFYIGGSASGQRGAVGTHTAGIISGLKHNNVFVTGVFFDNALPTESCNENMLIHRPKLWPGPLRKIAERLAIIFAAARVPSDALIYHRFDPLLTPFIVRSNMIVEYNDDVLAQIKFAADRGGWSRVGRIARMFLYPKIFRLSEKITFRRARLVVCVTESLCDFVRSIEPQANPVFVPNGSDAVFNPELVSGGRREDGTIHIAHVGTLTHWDGLVELLAGLVALRREHTDVRFHLSIVGDGALTDNLVLRVSELNLGDVVSFHDSMSHANAVKFLHDVDVVPLLKTITSYGLSPMKFYEALSLGCYLISTDVPHINEISSDEGAVVGLPLDPVEIASAIRFAYEKKDEIRANRLQRAVVFQASNSWTERVRRILEKT
jgi:glycosyltransferase involved in cell wall biosynthesis